MRLRFLLPVLVLFVSCAAGADSDPAIYMGFNVLDLERQAAAELQHFLYASSGTLMEIEQVAAVPEQASGYVLGTSASLPGLPEQYPFGLESPSLDGYLIHAISSGKAEASPGRPNGPDKEPAPRLVVISAPSPHGVLNGTYGFLEELGFGFYLGGDCVPEAPRKLEDLNLHASHSPAFATRGLLPWFNFFTGPTVWDLADYKAYIDQMVRMRLNFVGFHAYDEEPFAGHHYRGQLKEGTPLVNTSKPNSGTTPLSSEHFYAGTGEYFPQDYFGAASSFIEDPAESVGAAKETLRQAMLYAKGRGMKVCLGFEVRGDPLEKSNQSGPEIRLKSLLADYPMLDYVWIWEPEGLSLAPSYEPMDARSEWLSYANRWAGAFANLKSPKRRNEAVHVAHYAMQLSRVIQALHPDVRLIASGWGGDQWFRYTDFYPGMDRILPPEIIFSALDNVRMTPTVSKAYGELAAGRERWPIIWLEYDGDQWMPQPNLYETAGACRDALAKGCQGLLGVHWRTRAVEESATYYARFAWDTTLSVEQFCARRAHDLFGSAAGQPLSRPLIDLQRLGYRWVGGDGQNECSLFSWSPGEDAKVAELEHIAHVLRGGVKQPSMLNTMVGFVPMLVPGLPWPGDGEEMELTPRQRANLDDLVAQVEYVLAFERAARELAPGEGLDTFVSEDDSAAALALVERSHLARAMRLYAGRVRNKGELGVLATMNTKAWTDLRERLFVPGEDLGPLEMAPAGEPPALHVLPDRVIVSGLGERRPDVILHIRNLGKKRFTERSLKEMGRTTYALSFPEEVVRAGSFEYGITVKLSRKDRLAWPPGFPASTQTVPALSLAEPVPAQQPRPREVESPQLACKVQPDRHSAVLTWRARPDESYTVFRDAQELGVVVDGWFEDMAPPSTAAATYRVVARNIASGKTADGRLDVEIPDLPIPQPPAQVAATTRAYHVVLGWESDSPIAAAYRVSKYNADSELLGEFDVAAAPGHYLEVSDPGEAGRAYTYEVTPIAPDGRLGQSSSRVGVICTDAPLDPRLRLSLSDDSFLRGLAQIAESGLALGGSGWAELPPQEAWDPEEPLTLSLWVNFDQLDGMPVLICKGTWKQPGYFVQVLRGQIRFYVAGLGTLDAGGLRAETWHHIAATYGSGEMKIYLNGKLVGRRKALGLRIPSLKPFLLGRYGLNEEVYFLEGTMDDIRIYDVALTPQEITEVCNEQRPE